MFLSVIVPCYNEEEVIEIFYNKVSELLSSDKELSDYEIIMVDDGSKDSTLDKLKKINEKDFKARYISFSRNFGKEAAIYAGLKNSNGDLIVLLDADLQHPPELMNEMIRKIKYEGYDSVGAVRVNRKEGGTVRKFFSKNFYKFINSISDIKIEKNSTDYRMMTRQFKDSVLSLSEYNRFTKGIFSWVGYNNAYIYYDDVKREVGESKWSLNGLLKYSFEGIISFSTAPLVFSSIIGILSCGVAIVAFLVFLVKSLLFGDTVKGFPTIICSIFFIGGVQLLSIGILGQYLSKTYLEVKNRPIFIERERSK